MAVILPSPSDACARFANECSRRGDAVMKALRGCAGAARQRGTSRFRAALTLAYACRRPGFMESYPSDLWSPKLGVTKHPV